jgi:hypothetical protein
MSTLFVLALLGASFGFFVAGFKAFKRKELKKGFKRIVISVVAFLVMFVTIGIFASIQDKQEKKKAAEVAAYHKTPEYAEKVKKEKEAQAAKEADEKEVAAKKVEDAKEKAKEGYLKELKPQIDKITNVYDSNWNNIWKPTMTAIGKGSTDYFTAYNNMQKIKDNYEGGRFISLEPVSGMTKEQKKLLETYADKMGEAFSLRSMAVDKAQDMFNTGVAQPSDLNKITSYSNGADKSMIEAVSALTQLQMELGISPSK